MTPSEKPERSEPHQDEDANRTSVITHDEAAEPGTAAGEATTEKNTEGETATSADGGGADGGGESQDGTETPPPWQRATTAAPDGGSESGGSPAGASSATGSSSSEATSTADEEPPTSSIPKPSEEPETLRMSKPGVGQRGSGQRTSGPLGGGPRSGAATASSSSRRPNRGPRRASLQVRRVDPWSVLKLALVLSVALFFVWMIAVAVLYGVLDGMGVWDQLNGTFTELTQSGNTANESLISAGKVFSVASVVGGINIVLFTALATVAAFIYNVAADFAGGIELTLSERE